jgi:hypothetical protein
MSKLGDFLKKGIGALTGGDIVTDLIANAVTSKVLGGDTKDALMFTMLQKGLGGDGLNLGNLFGGGEEKVDKVMAPSPSYATMPMGEKGREVSPLSKAVEAISGAKNIDPVFKQGEGTLGYAKFLIDAGLLEPDSKIANLLNSKVGEALATGLGSQLLSKFDKEEQLGSGAATRPFGGEGNVNINIPRRYAAGGFIDGQYFPRRNGGIMPSEGSGQKDDVPAMLMAGEFVLTKDAVKGLGNGDSQKGIQKAYSMMNQLERKANNYG